MGVGDILSEIIPPVFAKCEECRKYVTRMNEWGVSGCEHNFDEIVNRLCFAASKRAVVKHFGRVNRVMARRWVRRAIETALARGLIREHFHKVRVRNHECIEASSIKIDQGTGKPSNGDISPIKSFSVLTSFSPLAHHLTRQSVVVKSWKAWGLNVISRNASDEISELQKLYPQVDQWIEDDQTSQSYPRKTQRIRNLCRTAIEIGRPMLLINSDCEIYGDQSLLLDKIADRSLVAGLRWNFRGSCYAKARRERWGIDAFYVTPEMAWSLPDLDFAIGYPMWDYWLPCHFLSLGYEMRFIGEPLIFHHSHKSHWLQKDLDLGASWVRTHYGDELGGNPETLRRQLPFPPR
jgi:hypothetical protein